MPELVTQDHDPVVTADVLVGRVGAAERGPHAQCVEDVERDGEARDRNGLAVDDRRRHRECGANHAEMIERARAFAPRDEIGRGDHVAGRAAAVRLPDRHDAIGITVGQRLEHYRADDAEDRRGGADAHRERQQGGDGEAGRARQQTEGVAEVTHRIFEQRESDFVARALGGAGDAPESDERLTPCFLRAHAGAPKLLDLLIDVEGELFIETPLEGAASHEGTEAAPDVHEPLHNGPQLLVVVASSTRLTARDMRCHCANSSVNRRRPAPVSA